MSQEIPKSVPAKYRARIANWDDERAMGNSLIVTLNDGWRFPNTECHTSGFDTIKEAVEGMRDTQPCNCEDCCKAMDAAAHRIIVSLSGG